MLLYEFDCVFAPLASLRQGALIEFMVKYFDQLYLDQNESLLLVREKITNADNLDIGANTASPVNLTLHSLFSQMSVEFNAKPVSEPNHLYPYRAYLKTLINYSEDTEKPVSSARGGQKTAEHMNVIDVTKANVGLRTRAVRFASSNVVKLIGRPQLDMFQQDRLIPHKVDVHLKLIPTANNFLIKSVAPQQNGAEK